MPVRIALLRGINVGKAKRVAMADLRTMLEGLGYGGVRTMLNSGNAVFTASGTASKVAQDISSGIKADLGLDVKVLVRTAAELDAIVAKNPFPKKGIDSTELAVAFLSGAAPAATLKRLDASGYEPDGFEIGDGVLYLHRPNGVMASRLPDWQKVLDVDVTERNWNVATKLQQLAAGT